MIQSMTGFGEAQLEERGHAYHLELRSVNNRYFKTAMRLPDELAFMETELEQLLRKRISRGSLTVRLYTRDLSAAAAADVNVAALSHYLAKLRAATTGQADITIDAATLATLPGVCQPHEFTDEEREHSAEVVGRLVSVAADRLIAMRTTEGQALAADLLNNCRLIRERLGAIRTRGPAVIEEYRSRLMQRVGQLIAGSNVTLAQEDLVREVAIYADRSDISEEVSRLESHLEQFDEAIRSPEPAGRKLEFIAQEMLREANTMGSKAGDSEITRGMIEIKSAIDRIKEQVANVE